MQPECEEVLLKDEQDSKKTKTNIENIYLIKISLPNVCFSKSIFRHLNTFLILVFKSTEFLGFFKDKNRPFY